jgi:AsmA protein
MLRAALHSESADLSDLMALAGAGRLTDRAGDKGVAAVDEAGPVRGVAPQGVSPRGGPQRLFPDRVFDGERLKTLDAHVSLQAKRLSAAALPELESLSLTADLHEGVLALKPIDLGLAGGHVVGSLGLDGRQQLLSMRAKMELKGIRLEKLLARLAQGARSAGPLDGRIELKGQGDSVARILARSTGSVELSLEGGGISNLLDAKLGLNGGKLLRLMIAGDRAIGINRALAAFDFHEGVGTSKTILLDTDQTRTEGAGIVDLRDETVDLLLTPHPKKPGLFSLRASIRVHGPLRKPAFSLRRKADDATAQAVDPGARLRVTFGSIRGPQQRRQPSP